MQGNGTFFSFINEMEKGRGSPQRNLLPFYPPYDGQGLSVAAGLCNPGVYAVPCLKQGRGSTLVRSRKSGLSSNAAVWRLRFVIGQVPGFKQASYGMILKSNCTATEPASCFSAGAGGVCFCHEQAAEEGPLIGRFTPVRGWIPSLRYRTSGHAAFSCTCRRDWQYRNRYGQPPHRFPPQPPSSSLQGSARTRLVWLPRTSQSTLRI